MQSSAISFKSNIKIVNSKGFCDELKKISPHEVAFPWTINEIIKAPRVYTVNIKTCTAGGILTRNNLTDKIDVVMFHIDPENKANSDFKKVKEALLKKIGSSQPYQAFLIGSKPLEDNLIEPVKKIFKNGVKMFANFENFIKELRLPFSKMEGLPPLGHNANIIYDAKKDQWTVFNTATDYISEENLKRDVDLFYDNIVISPKDRLIG